MHLDIGLAKDDVIDDLNEMKGRVGSELRDIKSDLESVGQLIKRGTKILSPINIKSEVGNVG